MLYSLFKDFGGPVATIIAAISAVSVTGYFARKQWRTAEEKVRLDLFDRRLALYEELRSVVGRHLGSGIDETALFNFKGAISRAHFLFGPEVTKFLDERWTDLSRDMMEWKATPRPIPEEQREAATAKMVARRDRLVAFFSCLLQGL